MTQHNAEIDQPIEERLFAAMLEAGLDETDAQTAMAALLDVAGVTEWRTLCNHGATLATRDPSIGQRNDNPRCGDLRVQRRTVVEYREECPWHDERVLTYRPGQPTPAEPTQAPADERKP